MTLYEYSLQIKAAELREIDRIAAAVDAAFIDRAANATDRKGRYKFKKPSEIFDAKRQEEKILFSEKTSVFERLHKRSERLAEFREKQAIEKERGAGNE